MDFKWLEEMLGTIGINRGEGVKPQHPEYKKLENEVKEAENELMNMESQLINIKRKKDLMGSIAGISFMILLFLAGEFWIAVIVAAILGILSDYLYKDKAYVLKNKIREGMAVLETRKVKLRELQNILSSREQEYKQEFGKYVEADYSEDRKKPSGMTEGMVNDTAREVEDELSARYPDSTPEARIAYKNLESVNEKIPALEEHDKEIASVFKGVFDSAMKTAKFIHGEREKENRAFLFFNHVETLEKWCTGILELEEKDVYDSLLVNVKLKAKEALPILQEKINKEYYRFVNPDIADLESEMTVMSKEIY